MQVIITVIEFSEWSVEMLNTIDLTYTNDC